MCSDVCTATRRVVCSYVCTATRLVSCVVMCVRRLDCVYLCVYGDETGVVMGPGVTPLGLFVSVNSSTGMSRVKHTD